MRTPTSACAATTAFVATSILTALALSTITAAVATAAGPSSIRNTPHNLSAAGPGTVKAAAEQEVCIFCHTPHNAAPIQPLWNRATPASAYRVYSSKSLDALPGQPTGSSKLCLSCHDGTIALGSVLSRSQRIEMAGGMTVLPPGAKSNLGTDLSDDHPISFKYDSALAAKDRKLRDPSQLPEAVRLDRQQELQCTSCHEPHDNSKGKFLVMDNSSSQLCNSCHVLQNTNVASHQSCASCHQSHSAPSGPFLLKGAKTVDTCTTCHGPSTTQTVTAAANVVADLKKVSRHDTGTPVNQADHVPNNADCADCHGPHTMKSGTAVAPNLPPSMGLIDGVDAAGSPVATARYEYEVCFKCHADKPATLQPTVRRQIVQDNKRLQFASTAVSFHPVEQRGVSNDVPSLNPNWTTASVLYCNDCHNSDTGPKAGGTGPGGVHGSAFKPLLALRYDTTDGISESAATYALCYKCHSRTSILGDVTFPHKLHVVDKQTPCSVCHDAHGISSAQGSAQKNARLINFDASVVTADPGTNKLEFNQTGIRAGACFLSCHNTTHSGTTYNAGGGNAAPAIRRAAVRRPVTPAPAPHRGGAAPPTPRK